MKEKILNNLNKPEQLEKLYRDNKIMFKSTFQFIYPDIKENQVAQVWHERLNFEHDEISWGTSNELIFVLIASLLAGFIAKIPAFTTISEEFFYPRNIGFIVFPLLSAYFFWKQKINTQKLIIVSVAFLIAVFYINWLPNDAKSDTLILACIHLPLFLWAVLGFTFIGEKINDPVALFLVDINTVTSNLTGKPSISIPFAVSNGLPIGIQLLAGRNKDKSLTIEIVSSNIFTYLGSPKCNPE